MSDIFLDLSYLDTHQNLYTGYKTLLTKFGFDTPTSQNPAKNNLAQFLAKLNSNYKLPAVVQNSVDYYQFLGFLTDKLSVRETSEAFAQADYKNLTFAAVELKPEKLNPTRTELAQITRAINRVYSNVPVVVLIRYQKTDVANPNDPPKTHFSIASAFRRNRAKIDKRYKGEVVEKISMVKDVCTSQPHRGHVDILQSMRKKDEVKDFNALFEQWLNVFDLNILNRKFYQEIANWFFWARAKATFPTQLLENKTPEESQQIANEIGAIRLITRLIFVWFLKEKSLVPKNLFKKQDIHNLINDFDLSENSKGNYYKAILQNLFFATLNRPILKREFALKSEKFYKNKEKYGINNCYRYEWLFQNPNPDYIKGLFSKIPFVNGGLFESLDAKEKGKPNIDGFSREEKNNPIIPDYLFFGQSADNQLFTTDAQTSPNYSFSDELGKIYDTKKTKYSVSGILQIFENYKFTVEENTPQEQEVALDPDLLGQIFENLLAYHNPETSTTARKGTGSFYTPREIVDYMVAESLLEFLCNSFEKEAPAFLKLGELQIQFFSEQDLGGQIAFETTLDSNPDLKTLKEGFRQLLDNDFVESPFSDIQNQKILARIYSNLKILDPACGSGAFPMAILDKLVQIVQKLDPDNQTFKEVILRSYRRPQLSKTENDELDALEQSRAEKLKELELDKADAENFRNSETRQKTIALIEQQIAEITQKADAQIQEIKKLLEANFEADFKTKTSNYARKLYLIQNCIYGVDIQPIAIQISKLRFFLSLIIEQTPDWQAAENFGIETLPNLETKFVAANTLVGLDKTAQTSLQKVGIQDKIDALKDKLKILRAEYFELKDRKRKTELVAEEKDIRKALAEFLEEGFGNIAAQQIANFNIFSQTDVAPWFDPEWMFGVGSGFDIIVGNPPYVSSKDLTNKEIYKHYISATNQFDLYTLFIEKSLDLLKTKGCSSFIIPDSILARSSFEVIRKALLTETSIKKILQINKVFNSAIVSSCIYTTIKEKSTKYNFDFLKYETIDDWKKGIFFSINLSFEKIKNNNYKILAIPQAAYNLLDYFRKLPKLSNFVFMWRGEEIGKKDEILLSKPTHSSDLELLNGSNIKKYCISGNIEFISKFNIKKNLSNYKKNKIMIRQVGDNINATYDTKGRITNQSVYNLYSTGKINEKFILAILNSKVIDFIYQNLYSDKLIFPRILLENLKQLPIPQASEATQKLFEVVVEYIMWLKEAEQVQVNKYLANEHLAKELEAVLDAMVFEVYFPESVQAAGAEVLAWVDFEPLELPRAVAQINAAFEKISASNSVIRNHIIKQQTQVKEVMLINGSVLL